MRMVPRCLCRGPAKESSTLIRAEHLLKRAHIKDEQICSFWWMLNAVTMHVSWDWMSSKGC
jgi:hypothetical protein